MRAVGREGAVCCRHRATVQHALHVDPGGEVPRSMTMLGFLLGPLWPGARGGRFRADLSQFSGISNESLNRSELTHIDETLLSIRYLYSYPVPNQN